VKTAGAAVSLLIAGLATPAFATVEIVCGNGKDVSVDLLVGHAEVIYVDRILVDIGEKSWSSNPESMPGTPIGRGQAFEDDRQLLVDITSDETGEIVGRLRVFSAEEGEDIVSGGVFSFKGEGAWVVDCTDPE
jgi:hypothetical protein